MRALFAFAAAATAFAFASPAPAGDRHGFAGGPALTPHQLDGPVQFAAPSGRFDHRRHGRRGRGTVVVGDLGWNDAWALYNNRTFQSDSYNDWWHDRPDRSYPAWMQRNRNCERIYWSGGGWTC